MINLKTKEIQFSQSELYNPDIKIDYSKLKQKG